MENTMSTSGLLEWELSLSSEQMISHGWYHGALSRAAAESLLQQDRQFLVRDSTSQPDNYVLSCRSNGQHLHFVIQRIVVHPETVFERYQYQFEDEAYDTVADLITSYVGSGKPISAASGARIQYPANRAAPLTALAAGDDAGESPDGDGASPDACAPYSHFAAKPGRPRAPLEKQRSHSLTPADVAHHAAHGKSASADGVIQGRACKRNKVYSSESRSSPGARDVTSPPSPPAKPARRDGVKTDDGRLEAHGSHRVSGSDSGNGSGDSTQSSAHGDPTGAKNDCDCGDGTTPRRPFDYELAEARLMRMDRLDYTVESRINFETFRSQIIADPAPKPLQSETLHAIKLSLRTSGPRILADHLTKVDLHFLFDESIQIEGLDGTASGIELCFLPQGRALRSDVIERVETFRLLVAVTVLTCQTDRQRADTINDWILLAIETKTALGNLYGFSAIMFGLCMPQVECLENAWNILRRVYTDNAFMFEAKLRPCFKSMNEGTNPLPPNTTTPYVVPPVLCFQLFDGPGGEPLRPDDTFPGALANTLDFDFHATAAHLEAARHFPRQAAAFKRNARAAAREPSPGAAPSPLLLELFRTEFHASFLWGERGALTAPAQRFARLTDILTAMAAKVAGRPPDADDMV